MGTYRGLRGDRCFETTTTTGTGSLTLGGVVTADYRTFDSWFASLVLVHYTIYGIGQFEVGAGVFTSPSTLSRDYIFASNNSGAVVSLSAGTHYVFADLTMQDICDIGLATRFANARVFR